METAFNIVTLIGVAGAVSLVWLLVLKFGCVIVEDHF